MGSIPSGYGLVSGFDTATLVQRMMAFQSQGRSRLEARVGLMQSRQSALLDLNAGLLAMSSATSPLSSRSIFQAVMATSSDNAVLQAQASSSSSPGLYQFIVAGLATNHQILTSGFASDESALGLQGATLELGGGGLQEDMPLTWLNGGEGVERGYVSLVNIDTGESETIDLGDVATINDVIDRLSENELGITASLNNGAIILESASGNAFSVSESAGSSTATDLGILGESQDGTLNGSNLAFLGGGLSLAALNDGNGVLVREGLADIRINTSDGRVFGVDLSSGTVVRIDDDTLLSGFNEGTGVSIDTDVETAELTIELVEGSSGQSTSWDIDLTGCVTAGDVRSRVASATGGAVTLGYRDDQLGFNIQAADSADTVMVHGAGTGGDATAEDLGLLNDAGSLGGFEGLEVSAFGGSGSPTLQDVLDAINNSTDQAGLANGGAINARISEDGLRLEIEDTTTGTSIFSVGGTSSNATAYKALGFGDGVEEEGIISGRRIMGSPGSVLVHQLFGGQGLQEADELELTDRLGNSASISGLSQHETLDELINALNEWASSSSLAVEFQIGRTGIRIQAMDGDGNLEVQGSLADQMGLAVDDDVSFVETGNLQHRWISESMLLDDLNQGRGIGTGSFRLRDATGATATVTLSQGHQTVQDVIDLINSRGLAVNARINDSGDGLYLESTAAENQSVVTMQVESLSGSTASDLQLEGESDVGIDGSWETVLSVDSQTTLRQLVEQINESGADVTAALVSTGDPSAPWRMSLTSEVSGVAGRMVLDLDGIDVTMEDVVTGQDARIVFGDDVTEGVMITHGSNHLENVIDGLTLDLLEVSNQPVTVTVSRDETTAIESLRAFVDAINQVLERIDSVSGYDPDTNERGILHGDPTVSRIRRVLMSSLQQRFESDSISLEGLWSVGITIGAGGRIEFDEATFSEVWSTRREEVEQLFTAEMDEGEGLGLRLDNLLESFTGSESGTLTRADESWQSRIDLAMDRLDILDARMEARRVRLIAEFAAMEEALALMQSQSVALLSMGSGMNSGGLFV